MKYLIILILAVMLTWSIIGAIIQDMDFGGMALFIGGITCGYLTPKSSRAEGRINSKEKTSTLNYLHLNAL